MCVCVCACVCMLGSVVYNVGALVRPDAVVVMENSASRALAAWHTGLEALGLDHTQGYVTRHTRHSTWGSALVKHEATVHWTAHRWWLEKKKTEACVFLYSDDLFSI